MKNKNRNLLILLGVQVVVIALLAFSGNSRTGVNFETDLFTVKDTASISRVVLTHDDLQVELKESGNKWLIDGGEVADRSLIFFMKSILNRVEVKRPISESNREAVLSIMKENGAKVEVYDGDELLEEFYAGGNDGKTKSYFASEGVPYIVNVPGYQDYLSGIFKLKAHQWKDRLIANTSWRSIKSIKVEKAAEDGFEVLFTGQDLTVTGIDPLDSGKMMNYVSQFSQFMINEFVLPGQFARYDSLAKAQPIATLQLTDIDPQNNLTLKVFERLPNEAYHLVTDKKGRMMMIDRRRMAGLIPSREYFVKVKRPARNF